MEIDITRFLDTGDHYEFSGSVAERGANAGPKTWANAVNEAKSSPMLKTDDELQALRDHVQAMGFGDEVQSYDADACNGLFIQLVSGDIREAGLDNIEAVDGRFDPLDDAWMVYREACENGQCVGNIYVGDIVGNDSYGKVFFTLSA